MSFSSRHRFWVDMLSWPGAEPLPVPQEYSHTAQDKTQDTSLPSNSPSALNDAPIDHGTGHTRVALTPSNKRTTVDAEGNLRVGYTFIDIETLRRSKVASRDSILVRR
jgi:hypothetical protein